MFLLCLLGLFVLKHVVLLLLSYILPLFSCVSLNYIFCCYCYCIINTSVQQLSIIILSLSLYLYIRFCKHNTASPVMRVDFIICTLQLHKYECKFALNTVSVFLSISLYCCMCTSMCVCKITCFYFNIVLYTVVVVVVFYTSFQFVLVFICCCFPILLLLLPF